MTGFFDMNLRWRFGDSFSFSKEEGVTDAPRTIHIFPTHGLRSKYEFDKCVRRYGGNRRVRTFSCYDQFLCMAFGQLTYRDSLRDVVTCLDVLRPKLFHVGIRGRLSRSTLADANENRDWRIYAEFAQVLIAEARALYADEGFGAELDNTVYALDSSTIDLCLSLFPWAKYHPACRLPRCRNWQAIRFSEQPLRATRTYHRTTVQGALASRVGLSGFAA